MNLKDLEKITSKQNINLVLVLVSFSLAIYLNWSFELAISLALLVYFILMSYASSFFMKVTTICGIISAVMLAIGHQTISEKMGVVSFISLTVFLIFQIVRARKNDTKT